MQYCAFFELAMAIKLCHGYASAVTIIMIHGHKGGRGIVSDCVFSQIHSILLIHRKERINLISPHRMLRQISD